MNDAVEELKIWLAVRADLSMPSGKLATQAGHGYAGALYQCALKDPDTARAYMEGASPKITVTVASEADLTRTYKEAIDAGICAHLVRDAGRTVFNEPTLTVCAFGPCKRSQLPRFLKRLRLLEEKTSNQRVCADDLEALIGRVYTMPPTMEREDTLDALYDLRDERAAR